jgi:hypothetical protein
MHRGKDPRHRLIACRHRIDGYGSVAEWSIAPVLKTGGSQGPVSSNLTASARPEARAAETADQQAAGQGRITQRHCHRRAAVCHPTQAGRPSWLERNGDGLPSAPTAPSFARTLRRACRFNLWAFTGARPVWARKCSPNSPPASTDSHNRRPICSLTPAANRPACLHPARPSKLVRLSGKVWTPASMWSRLSCSVAKADGDHGRDDQGRASNRQRAVRVDAEGHRADRASGPGARDRRRGADARSRNGGHARWPAGVALAGVAGPNVTLGRFCWQGQQRLLPVDPSGTAVAAVGRWCHGAGLGRQNA